MLNLFVVLITILVNFKDYNYWSAAIFHYEDIVLETLCFEDHAQVPHTIALDVIREFNGKYQAMHALALLLILKKKCLSNLFAG